MGLGKEPIMTTILVLNAISSLIATVAIGGYLVRQRRRTTKAVVMPLYVTTRAIRPRRHR
jgi:hypothetical protein